MHFYRLCVSYLLTLSAHRCCILLCVLPHSCAATRENRIDSPEMNVQYRMSVQEYEELTPYAGDLVENWGKAPGHLNSDGQNLLVFGAKFGNVFIGVQPTFGYEVTI